MQNYFFGRKKRKTYAHFRQQKSCKINRGLFGLRFGAHLRENVFGGHITAKIVKLVLFNLQLQLQSNIYVEGTFPGQIHVEGTFSIVEVTHFLTKIRAQIFFKAKTVF